MKSESGAAAARIILVAQAYPDGGGISGIIEMLVPALSSLGEVHLAVGECGDDAAGRLKLEPRRVHDLRLARRLNPLVFPTSVLHGAVLTRRLLALIEELGPSLLIAQDAVHVGPSASLAGRLSRVRTAVMDHGTLTNLNDRRWLPAAMVGMPGARRAMFTMAFAANRPVHGMAWRAAMRLASEAWFVGNELSPFFAHAGPRAKRYRQLMPTDFAVPTEEQRLTARTALGIPEAARVVNLVSRLDPEKGLVEVAQALGEQAPRHPELVVVVAGEGRIEQEFKRWVVEAGCGASVRFVGRLERADIQELHWASDIHLYAGTLGCAVSIALLEAMCAGVVPVVSDVPSFHNELINNSGFVFRAGDVGDLSATLGAALSLPLVELRRRGLAAADDLGAWTDPGLPRLVSDLLP